MPIPAIQITQSVASAILAQSGSPALATLQGEIDSTFAPKSMPVGQGSVSGNVKIKRTVHMLKNVMAWLPGKGPRAHEIIVIGGHYDHLGIRRPPGAAPGTPEQIHNGADDNASGTAGVMELARLFVQAGPQRRSLLFVGFSAEEVGLIGSYHWVNNPPVPLDRVVAMINLDQGQLADPGRVGHGRAV
jgi:Zn-dependent M28 family amino/carboxypeptidase